jgi:formylglycine-generating enzyme required for sulfatase activity
MTSAFLIAPEAVGFFLRNAAIRSKIFRGGSWHASAFYCRVAFRSRGYSSDLFTFLGFGSARGL